jgi:hypothetical protein
VRTVLVWRESWLKGRGLSLNTVIRGDLADSFLADAKHEFHGSDVQRELQERDAGVKRKKSRAESIPGGLGTYKS